jgi:hypothetical protein
MDRVYWLAVEDNAAVLVVRMMGERMRWGKKCAMLRADPAIAKYPKELNKSHMVAGFPIME